MLKSKLEYEKFIHQNKLKNGQWKFRATRVPKKKYRQSLNLTDRQLKYRNFLMATYFKDQQSIPREKRLYTQLPSIVKNNNDRWRELGLDSKHKYFKYQYESIMNDLDARDEETFRVTDNSEVEEGERMKNTNNLFVPVLYSNKRIDANDVRKTQFDTANGLQPRNKLSNNKKILDVSNTELITVLLSFSVSL